LALRIPEGKKSGTAERKKNLIISRDGVWAQWGKVRVQGALFPFKRKQVGKLFRAG